MGGLKDGDNFLIFYKTKVSIGHFVTITYFVKRIIYDHKALFAKRSWESEEFKHLNGFFSYFL